MKLKFWTELQLREAVKSSTSIRQVLIKLGLREAGGNYAQIKKYISFYQINAMHFTGKGWNRGKKGMGRPKLALSEIMIRNSYFQSFKLKKGYS